MQKNWALFFAVIVSTPGLAVRTLVVPPILVESTTLSVPGAPEPSYQGGVFAGMVRVNLLNLVTARQDVTVTLNNEIMGITLGIPKPNIPSMFSCPTWSPMSGICGVADLYSAGISASRTAATGKSKVVSFTATDPPNTLRQTVFTYMCGLTSGGPSCVYDPPSPASWPASPMKNKIISTGISYNFQLNFSVEQDRGAVVASIIGSTVMSTATGTVGMPAQVQINAGRPF